MEPTKLPEKERLAEELADPDRHRFSEAVALAKAALKKGTAIDKSLGEILRGEVDRYGPLRRARIVHLLNLLSEIDCDHEILPIKAVLLAKPDPYIRSKATLMVGRATRNVQWIGRRMLESDARVQANAITSLRGIDTPEARELLTSALKSNNNRVVANALLGLYSIQDIGSIRRLLAMAERPEETFRISARWAMGETGDPRFLPNLTAMYEKDTGKCRGMVVRALGSLRRRLEATEKTGSLTVYAWEAQILPGGARRIGISLLRGSREAPILIEPLEVVIQEGARQITEYSLVVRPEAPVMAVGFVRPRITSQVDPYRLAIESALHETSTVKRKRDLWTLDRYISGQESENELLSLQDEPEDPLLMRHLRNNRGFLTEAEMIARVIPGPGPKPLASRDIADAAAKLMDAVQRASGARHIFIFLDPEKTGPDAKLEQLMKTVRAGNPSVHGIAMDEADHSAFAELCETTGGSFTALPADRLPVELPRMYQGLLNRYQITYGGSEVAEQPGPVEIAVYCHEGFGKTVIQLTAQRVV